MNLKEKATIIHYHRQRINTFNKGTIGALGWRKVESQTKRFEVIANVGDLSGRTLLDVGCGYGDLKEFLDRRFSGFTYIGIDQMPEFIAEAKTRYASHPNTYFSQTDFTKANFPTVDYVIASGALVYRCVDPNFYAGMIRKMYQATTQALAFNMLDAAQFPNHPLLVGHDRDNIIAFCRTLSPRVTVTTDYLDDDFTVFMFRE